MGNLLQATIAIRGVRPLLHREHMARQTAFHRSHVEALRGPRPESGKRHLNGKGSG
jgi:hypothetical protein